MKQLLLSLLFALMAVFGLQAQTIWDGTADTSWYNETSTEFEISTAEQLAGLAKLVNNGNDFSGKTILITADIVLNDTSDWENWESSAPNNTWTPIGTSWIDRFYGTFDGQGHTVSGIYINSSDYGYQGLFGYNNGTIQNVGISKSYIKGYFYVGGVCGYNDDTGTFSNCYNSGEVSGNSYVGGVCGYNSGTISDCYNLGKVNSYYYAGGICGNNYDTISNCYYLEDSATGGINSSDKSGQAEAKTAEQFASGEVCWLLNGSSDANPTWFQTINTDDSPVLDNTHGTVYAIGNCPGSIIYNNNSGPSHIGEHADNDHDGRCDFCGKIMTSEPAQKDGVYQICNRAELYWFAGLVNGSLDGIEQNTAANAVLTADIIINENVLDANGNLTESTENLLVWSPIGLNWITSFYGTFDGQGHTVSGIYINSSDYGYQGLFGSNNGTIKNVGVTESYIKGDYLVGGVCGHNSYGTISNCYNAGTVSGDESVGGVCGSNSDTISGCYNTGNVNGNDYVGGVCGYNDGTISGCYNSGNVSGTGEYTKVGGVCGENYSGTISGCYNAGTVSGNESVGGVCGSNGGTISDCCYLQGSATGGINGSNLIGQAEVKTAEQFASGEVCWLLNGSSDANPTWFQTINTDDSPVLDNTHGTVYAIGNCPGSIIYNNNSGPSHIGEHADNDHDFRCDYCGMVMLQEPELSEGVYQISNLAELYWFAGLVNGSLDGIEQNTAANAVLTADIIINENVLDANGNLTESTDDLLVWVPMISFSGYFNGQGHTVNGIYINSENDYQGLFGYNNGTIKNVGVTESYIKGIYYVGGVCGYNNSTISNCYNSGIVSGYGCVGGVCGYSYYGTISNCYNTAHIVGIDIENADLNAYIGGVCGENYGTISSCYNTGTINGSGERLYIGIIANGTTSQISNCYYLEGCTTNEELEDFNIAEKIEAKTAEQFTSGEVCWLLNGSSDTNPTWFQTLGTDDTPVLDNTHGTVYATGRCPNDGNNKYSNQGPSRTGEHSDNDKDGFCDFCGKIMPQEPAQSDGIYQISNCAELYWFAGLVNGTLDGVGQITAADAVLVADIIINKNVPNADGSLTSNTESLLAWTPIGQNYNNPFRGSFDGQGHTVSGIYINCENDYQGLFGYNMGTIKNVGVTKSYITGGSQVGGVCGQNGQNGFGSISNCYNSGTVSGYWSVGGVCGQNSYCTISNCYNSGIVNGDRSVGGVCGQNSYGTISNCYYLEGTAEGGIDGEDISNRAKVKTAEQFASGEVCWLLNEEESEGAWGQKLGTDPCPVLGGPAVFKNGETYYNEEGSAIVETNSEQASFVIVPENLTIKIYGSDGEATVYNLAGNIIYKGSERIIPVTTAGMYLVRIGNEVQKTVVR